MPKLPPPPLRSNLPSPDVVVTTHRTPDGAGRLGHEVKNIAAGALVAALFGWSYLPPAVDGPLGFTQVSAQALDLTMLGAPPLLRSAGTSLQRWSHYGCCPPTWNVAHLNETRYSGFTTWDELKRHVYARVPLAMIAAGRLCVVTSRGFRVHLYQSYAWERAGHVSVRPSPYSSVTRALRNALRPLPPRPPAIPAGYIGTPLAGPAACAEASRPFESAVVVTKGVSQGDSVGRLAVHVRRGDKAEKQSEQLSPLWQIRASIALVTRAMLATGLYPAGVAAVVFTEPNATGTEELLQGGALGACPPAQAVASSEAPSSVPFLDLPAATVCCVTSGSVLSDLHGMVRSSALVCPAAASCRQLAESS
jgi:hypothetical protein